MMELPAIPPWMAWVVSAAVLLLVCCWVTCCILARMFHSATKFSPEYSEWVENKNKNKKVDALCAAVVVAVESDCKERAE